MNGTESRAKLRERIARLEAELDGHRQYGDITLTLDHQEAQAILNGLYEGGALKGPLYFDHVLRLKSKVETAMTAAGFPPIKRQAENRKNTKAAATPKGSGGFAVSKC